jgi:hypothetical protein
MFVPFLLPKTDFMRLYLVTYIGTNPQNHRTFVYTEKMQVYIEEKKRINSSKQNYFRI